jgi:tetratricopeptide (TPR) repeat protein
LNKFFARGGKSKDAYLILYQIYSGPKEDKLKALEIVRKGKEKLPNNSDFPKLEIGLLIDLDRVAEAKGGLEETVKKDPGNKILHFYLGYVNSKLEKWDDAKANFETALKLDPQYFEAQYYLAQIYFIDAIKVKKEMDNLGISAADKKRKIELDKVVVDKYKTAVPYWEKAEQLKPDDLDVLDKLSALYYYLGEDAKIERISKKKKLLGAE